MITPEKKDEILKILCEQDQPEVLHFYESKLFHQGYSGNQKEVSAILRQFNSFGIIMDLNERPEGAFLILPLSSFDFLSRGGFTLENEVFLASLEKLHFEVEHLKKELGPDYEKKLTTLSTVGQTIIAVLSLIKK